MSQDKFILSVGAHVGGCLVDGLGDGVMVQAPGVDKGGLRSICFGLLQGCRMRNTKTEYVSCPSCGRTLFDLQEVSQPPGFTHVELNARSWGNFALE